VGRRIQIRVPPWKATPCRDDFDGTTKYTTAPRTKDRERLPDAANAERRALTIRFKRERELNPSLDWTDWLSQKLQLTTAARPALKSS
jgi:hypothetical protein